ncbi:MAG TPA: DUF2326 domain-containing protein [Terriglobales bacterium]|nr:DUF2326 domain-containing protein [Terriglobales bacterium]
MKIAKIYSSPATTFVPIRFNGIDDDRLSVVLAKITRPKDKSRDSHNLGKTTLIHLIDFLLLKEVSEKNSFLLKHQDRFEQFVFYIELQPHTGDYVTIRRGVQEPTKISLKRHPKRDQDLSTAGEKDWDHCDIPIDTARHLVDSYLDLQVVKPWNYRKGVSYFLRTQADYQDYFQISKFLQGRDSEWKPYLAHLVGLNFTNLESKYGLDSQIEELEKKKEERQAEVQIDEKEFSKLSMQLEIDREEVTRTATLLDNFDFREEEKRVNKELIEDVERRTSELNSEIYKTGYDLDELRNSLAQGFSFRSESVRQIFEETKTYVPADLLRDYDELVGFNRKLTTERNKLLKGQIRELEQELEAMNREATELSQRRVHYLELLRNADAFKKFKALQREHADQRAQLTYRETQLERLSQVREMTRELRNLEIKRKQLVDEITNDVERDNATTKKIALQFHALVKRVLDLNGSFYVAVNRGGNVEFMVETKLSSKTSEVSSQSEGTSYKKLLCALFDIALLTTYATEPFYHFVYHDGIFEGLDTRKRRVLLELLRETATKHHIQYMLSTIDSDLPRDENDRKIEFPPDEVVLELSDQGTKGRLFRMPEF